MKRSQVLKLIEGLYSLEIQKFPKENPSDIFAENLLCHLEYLGMLPPTTSKLKNVATVDDVNPKTGVVNFTTSQSFISINEWDEE